jgi:hypothetical protein
VWVKTKSKYNTASLSSEINEPAVFLANRAQIGCQQKIKFPTAPAQLLNLKFEN